ncbi:3-dehydroquinate synthase [Candidatus Vidania fulgoroideorum]
MNNILFIRKIKNISLLLKKIKRKYFIVDYILYLRNKLFIKSLFKKNNYFIVKNSEFSKNFSTINKIVKDLLLKGFKKDCNLICIGGGVVGDISGFIASIYYRGINYINVPSTLLSMVDSSIGGKNAINVKKSKNILGTIYFPKYIIIFKKFLKTLNNRNYLEGFSEILKISIINNKNLFNYLNKYNIKIIKLIFYSILSKISIIKKDLLDKNYRMLLNLGHTFGHSLEKTTKNYFSHGESVFLGIFISSFISYKKFYLKKKTFYNIILLLKKYIILKKYLKLINFKYFLNNIKYDKKNFSKYLKFILIKKIKFCNIVKINVSNLKKILKYNFDELVNMA